jgi:hypothetical protein
VTKSAGAEAFALTEVAVKDGGETSYELQASTLEDGRTEIKVVADAQQLSSSELLLKYPSDRLIPAEGVYGDWPKGSGAITQSADMGTPGSIKYRAQAPAGQAASGRFVLLSVVFEKAEASAKQ